MEFNIIIIIITIFAIAYFTVACRCSQLLDKFNLHKGITYLRDIHVHSQIKRYIADETTCIIQGNPLDFPYYSTSSVYCSIAFCTHILFVVLFFSTAAVSFFSFSLGYTAWLFTMLIYIPFTFILILTCLPFLFSN